MSSLPVAPDSLRVLFGNNREGLTFGDPGEFERWREKLPFAERELWRELPWKPGREGTKKPPYTFSYDRERLSLFQIDRNFSSAVQLLEECYQLRDVASDLEVKIREQDAAFKLAEALRTLEPAEDALLEQRLSAVGAAPALTIDRADGSTGPCDRVRPDGVNATRELELTRARREIAHLNQARLKAEVENPASPYHQRLRHARLVAKYNLRLAELLMYVEALKHGLLDVYGIEPYRLQFSDEDLERAIREFENYPEDMRRALQPPTPVQEPVEPEHHIRLLLWEAGKKLQALALHTDDFLAAISLRRDVLEKGPNSDDRWAEFTRAPLLKFSLPKALFSATQGSRLLGVSAQLILSDARTSHLVGPNDRGIAVEFSSEALQGLPIHFEVGLPTQPIPSTLERRTGHVVHLSTPASVLRQSTMLTGASTPVLYGKILAENVDPSAGEWTLAYRPAVDASQVKDVMLFLHLRHVPYITVPI